VKQAVYWQAEAGDVPAEQPQPLVGDHDADVVVLGGGYTGLWSAIALKQRDPGLRICVLEARRCGDGPSGRNGGFLHGWVTQLAAAVPVFGPAGALALASQGATAQRDIIDLCASEADDVWLRRGGLLRVATTPRQIPAIRRIVEVAQDLGFADDALHFDGAASRERCDSPRFLEGVFVPSAATVQPRRLLLLLRGLVRRLGIPVYENTPAHLTAWGSGVRAVSGAGTVTAQAGIVATGAHQVGDRATRRVVTNFSSYMVATEPVPDLLAELGWVGGEGLNDGRMFLHYFRTTPDGRVVLGCGAGPIAFGSRLPASLSQNAAAMARAERGLRRLLPALAGVKVEYGWGGPIDISVDGFPFVRRSRRGPIYSAGGFSGHGVNATYIAGQTLASLCVGRSDSWSAGPLVREASASFPPEPMRYVGASAIRSAILAVEEADDAGRRPSVLASAGAALPRLLNLRLGTR
jgi:glycine/D-amino acid oxidase-like deaminating enzyme